MESHYDTTFMPEWHQARTIRQDGYILVRSPHKGLYVRVQLGVDPVQPGTVLHVTDDELDALRYRRVTIMGIIEGHHQDEIRKAKLEQIKEIMKARAEMEQPKPVPVKMIIDKNKTTFVYSASNLPMLPGTYKVEVKEVVIT
jgi:hypothetical protein